MTRKKPKHKFSAVYNGHEIEFDTCLFCNELKEYSYLDCKRPKIIETNEKIRAEVLMENGYRLKQVVSVTKYAIPRNPFSQNYDFLIYILVKNESECC